MGIGWPEYTLGDLCGFKYGQMPKRTDLCEDGYPVFSGYRIVGCATNYHYEEPEIIVVARGVGGTGDVKMSPPKCFLTNLSIAVRVASSEVDKSFLYYRLAGTKLWELRTGSAQAQITIERLQRYTLRLPPLPTQKKIAAILSAYDDLIENNERRIRILEDMAQNLYREWFVKFRFPGHKKVKMVDSPLGKIPQGWKVCRLADLAEINARSVKKGEEPDEILYIDIASVTPGAITQTQRMKFSAAPGRARRIVMHGDLIWSCVRPNRRSFTLILNPEPHLIASTGFAVISATGVPFSYLYFALTTDEFVGYLVNHATGSAYPAVTAKDFESADTLKPEDDLMTRFHETVATMLELTNRLTVRNTGLRQTRDLLLPKLIAGEVSVSELNIGTDG